MKIKTNVKAGEVGHNHNEKTAIDKKTKSLIVRTGVKAGILDQQHNEKLTDDSSIDQNKSFGKKLRLSKETIRDLRAGRILKVFELKQAAGGAAISRLQV